MNDRVCFSTRRNLPDLDRRFVEKLDLISPTTNKEEAKRPLRLLAVGDLPERFGGQQTQWPPPMHSGRLPAGMPPIVVCGAQSS